jgi:GTPase SAR1 family protein
MFGWIGEAISATVSSVYTYFAGKEAKIILLGLDNAGKSTFLSKLTRNTITALEPTMNATRQTFVVGNLTITATGMKHIEEFGVIFFMELTDSFSSLMQQMFNVLKNLEMNYNAF